LGSFRFYAAPGDELTREVARMNSGRFPAGAELIALSDWPSTKDHLVGVDLNRDVDSLVKWLSVAGIAFAMFGAIYHVVDPFPNRAAH
jgi:hypothetical protein